MVFGCLSLLRCGQGISFGEWKWEYWLDGEVGGRGECLSLLVVQSETQNDRNWNWNEVDTGEERRDRGGLEDMLFPFPLQCRGERGF